MPRPVDRSSLPIGSPPCASASRVVAVDRAAPSLPPDLFAVTPGVALDRPAVEARRAEGARRVAWARELFDAVRAAALTRLSEVHVQIDVELTRFADLTEPRWGALERAIARDQALTERRDALRTRVRQSYAGEAGLLRVGLSTHVDAVRRERARLLDFVEQIDRQRSALRQAEPALALVGDSSSLRAAVLASTPDGMHVPVVDTSSHRAAILASTPHARGGDTSSHRAAILASMRDGARALVAHLDDVYRRVEDDDVPLHHLERLLPDVLEQLDADGDDERAAAMREAVEARRAHDDDIQFGATAASILFGVGAFVASGGTAALLGAVGAAVGLGARAHDFEIADDLADVADASLDDEGAMVDPDAARERYRAAVTNLTLAAADAMLSGAAVFTLARAASLRRAPPEVQEVFARLTPKQLVRLDRGRPADLERLATELDADTFATAQHLVRERAAARAAVPDLSDAAFAELYVHLGADDVRALAGLPATKLAKWVAEVGGARTARLAQKTSTAAVVEVAGALDPTEAVKLLAALSRLGDRAELLIRLVSPRFLAARLDDLGARELVRQVERLGARGLSRAVEAVGKDGAAAVMASRPTGATLNALAQDLADPTVVVSLARVDGAAVGRLLRVVRARDVAELVARAEQLAPGSMAADIVAYLGQPKRADWVTRELAFARQAIEHEVADAGHALARHGPQVSDEALALRVQTGVAPDGKVSKTPASARFESFEAFVVTRERAMETWARVNGIDLSRPPPATWDRRIERAMKRASGSTFEVSDSVFKVDHLEAKGGWGVGYVGRPGTETAGVRGTFESVDRAAPLRRTSTRVAWYASVEEPRRGRWVVVQHYPTATDFDLTSRRYVRSADARVPR